MDGDGGETVEPRGRGTTGTEFDLPSVLAQLDDTESKTQRTAVRRIRAAIDDRGTPAAAVPTVPKLRALLEQPSIDFRDEVAACLADLAAEAPADVAPSVDTIVTVAVEFTDGSDESSESDGAADVTRALLRCLAAVAADRPDVVADHTASIAAVLARGDGYDRRGLRALARVSRSHPAAVEPAASVLADALAADPDANGQLTLRALGRLAGSDATVPAFDFVEQAAALVEHDDAALRYDALGCLGDVARSEPTALEPVCAELEAALSSSDPDTRAIAAVTVTRLAAQRRRAINPVRDRLVALLEDNQAHVRANACVALGQGRVDAAAPRLETLARADPAPNVRDRAAWATEQLS